MGLTTGVPHLDNLVHVASNASIQTAGVTIVFTVLSLIFFTIRFLGRANTFPKIAGTNSVDGLDFKNGRQPNSYRWTKLLKQASDKFSSPFTIALRDFRSTVILPAKYTNDVKNNKDMSLDESVSKDFPIWLPGFEAMRAAQKNHVFHDAVRIKLTQALTFFTEQLSDEARLSLPELFPTSEEWQEIRIAQPVLDLVTRLSSLIFLGRDFAHAKEWREISASYTVNMFQAARVIRTYPKWSWSIVHWFLPEFKVLRKQIKQARKIIEPEVLARRQKRQIAEKEGTVPKKSLDSVDWFEDVRNGVEFDFVEGELLLSVVAIHTTSSTLANTLLDVCANPEIIQPLRDEIISVIKEDGGLKRTTLHKLKLMDSVLKESQRLHPLVQTTLRRKVLNPVTLHDGTLLPRGTYTLSGPMPNHDPTIYPTPYTFTGHRFLDLRAQSPAASNKWQFVSTQPEHMGFGHGMHACPGRFFASNELKVALMHLVMGYEWRLKQGETRPESLELGMELVVNPEARVESRAREKEVTW